MGNKRILFIGTPQFAVASLDALLLSGANIISVVTAQDKNAGRGRKLKQSAISEYANAKSINVLKPSNLRDLVFINTIQELAPDIIIVVAFRMLPKELWSIPILGTFNLHASLLPQYRGAAPINHAIMNGEKTTGVTTFLIDKEIDTGKILLQKDCEIKPTENVEELHNKLMYIGAQLVVETVKLLSNNELKPISQQKLTNSTIKLNSAPKIFTKDCFINFARSNNGVNNFIRGLAPYPGARFILKAGEKNILIKVLEAITNSDAKGLSISEISLNSTSIIIGCSIGSIEIRKVHPEGKKAMSTEEFLRGLNEKSLSIVAKI